MLQLLEALTNPSDAAIKTVYMLQLLEALTNPSDAAIKTQHICYNS